MFRHLDVTVSSKSSSKESSIAGSDISSLAPQEKTNARTEIDSESVSSCGSMVGNAPSSVQSVPFGIQDKQEASNSSSQEATDSGIDESNVGSLDLKASSSSSLAATEGSSVDISDVNDVKQEVIAYLVCCLFLKLFVNKAFFCMRKCTFLSC